MKCIDWASRAILAAAVLATASNAFASGLFGGLFNKSTDAEYAVDDESFFGGDALTIGPTAGDFAADEFATSATNGGYAACASCAGNADATPVATYSSAVYGGGIPAAVDCGCDACDVCAPCDVCCDPCWTPCDPCCFPCETGCFDGCLGERRPCQPIRNILRGVRNFFAGKCCRFCQPAYVCDPCWTVCDDCWSPCCDPCCAPCDPCCSTGCAASSCRGAEVYAPRGCCGDGFAPGETHTLNPETGLPGIDSSISPTPTTAAPTGAPIEATDAPAAQPAIPAAQPAAQPETVPTPQANPTLGSGVIKMLVPEDSIVYVNDYRTKQTGATRSFAANNLVYGETYSFEIRVVAIRDGKVFEDVQKTTLTAGDETALAFNLNLRANQAVAMNR